MGSETHRMPIQCCSGPPHTCCRPACSKTKIVATIGPTSCDRESLFRLADAGMSVVRLNMSHGDHSSHKVSCCCGAVVGHRARWVASHGDHSRHKVSCCCGAAAGHRAALQCTLPGVAPSAGRWSARPLHLPIAATHPHICAGCCGPGARVQLPGARQLGGEPRAEAWLRLVCMGSSGPQQWVRGSMFAPPSRIKCCCCCCCCLHQALLLRTPSLAVGLAKKADLAHLAAHSSTPMADHDGHQGARCVCGSRTLRFAAATGWCPSCRSSGATVQRVDVQRVGVLVGACQTSLGCCANLHPANLPSVHVCTEVRSGDVHEPLQLAAGDKVTFTIVEGADGSSNRVSGGWASLAPIVWKPRVSRAPAPACSALGRHTC